MQIGVETAKAVDQRRIFVIDEDEITRAALQFMLHDEIETHELASVEAAYEKANDWLKPDLLMVGISIIAAEGTGLIARIAGDFPAARILLIASPEEEPLALEALRAGAHGAVLKPLRLEEVRKKVDTILGREGGAPLIQLGGL